MMSNLVAVAAAAENIFVSIVVSKPKKKILKNVYIHDLNAHMHSFL